MRAYVINLARSTERRRHMEAQLARLGLDYQLVPAVDGRELDLDDPQLMDPELPRWGPGPGFRPCAAGCALSHMRVFRAVAQSGAPFALVLEDDVVLPADLPGLAEEVGACLTGAAVALLNFHAPEPCRVTAAGAIALSASRQLVQPLDMHGLTSAGAYVVTREACLQLLGALLPLRTYVDDWDFYCREGVLSGVRCVVPMPVTNSPSFRSTIDYYPPGSLQWQLRERFGRTWVPGLGGLLALRRRHTLRRLGCSGAVQFVDSAVD
jgi:glycosyl transferase family 25